jgi:hypothetical protein
VSIGPFSSDAELLNYARWFMRDRVRAFRKDLKICMTGNSKREHAYFPALITCIAFADLLTGLHLGNLNYPRLSDLQSYVARFFRNKSDYVHVDILYIMFRHKIAHIAYPYLVFDTSTSAQLSPPHRRIAWTVGIYTDKKPIELIDYPTTRTILKTKTAWPVPYNARIKVSLTAFRRDIVNSIYGSSGYLSHLRSDRKARENFAACMKEYAPP